MMTQSGEGSGAKPSDYAKLATDWLNVACGGGRGCLIGGCCRTTPEHSVSLLSTASVPRRGRDGAAEELKAVGIKS